MQKKGKVIIFSAPSGSGKTTIVKHLIANNPDLGFSISACTRDKRGREEQNGKDYYFLTPEEFRSKIEKEEFIEWEEVYQGNFYGTLKSEIDRIWNEGKNVIFDVDVKGGLNLKEYFGNKALAVFVKVPSIEELKSRLNDRGTDSEHSISQRVFKAKFELGFENKFDVTLLNESLDESLEKAQTLYDEFKEN
ncbi:guanylate kinase [Xanthovirga aplysinae]|uniref:guanylate kinase n=1 Tax=Xanthovirga aplysinae TaxID=2529853 RepID=UPI0012BC058A|nr:guanylate kinase [Xanthovirga aplysinae]MTI30264.1 guanylate kinase [Xanthovirga aplysinae]